MLRVTTHDDVSTLTLQVEGRLAGLWVRELEECWRTASAGRGARVVRVDLTGVTFVDATGLQLLAAMHTQGVEFVAAGCLMKAVVAEVTGTPIPEDCPEIRPGDPT